MIHMMVIAAVCSLQSKRLLISLHVLRSAVAHECPFRNPDMLTLSLRKLRENSYTWTNITLSVGRFTNLAPVVRRVDSAIGRINHYPMDKSISFASVFPLDSDLSLDSAIHRLNNWGLMARSCWLYLD